MKAVAIPRESQEFTNTADTRQPSASEAQLPTESLLILLSAPLLSHLRSSSLYTRCWKPTWSSSRMKDLRRSVPGASAVAPACMARCRKMGLPGQAASPCVRRSSRWSARPRRTSIFTSNGFRSVSPCLPDCRAVCRSCSSDRTSSWSWSRGDEYMKYSRPSPTGPPPQGDRAPSRESRPGEGSGESPRRLLCVGVPGPCVGVPASDWRALHVDASEC
mmetsp:Transcript_62326/g.177108  ORF Transcript_62326/g.177108 Transcript_62326/m.177108 type:complete len:218 (-) Transcript_62326:897-1550(-)